VLTVERYLYSAMRWDALTSSVSASVVTRWHCLIGNLVRLSGNGTARSRTLCCSLLADKKGSSKGDDKTPADKKGSSKGDHKTSASHTL